MEDKDIGEYWTSQGTILTVCKFKGNPIKNLLFNKAKGIDLMRTHFKYTLDREKFNGKSDDLKIQSPFSRFIIFSDTNPTIKNDDDT